MRALFLSLSGLVLGLCAAGAQENVVVTGQALRTGDPTQIVCKMGAPYLGSRIGAKKTCHPLGTWKQLEANAQWDIERMQTRTDNDFQTHH